MLLIIKKKKVLIIDVKGIIQNKKLQNKEKSQRKIAEIIGHSQNIVLSVLLSK